MNGQTAALYRNILETELIPALGCTEPVSYTHLDVYKRQASLSLFPIIPHSCSFSNLAQDLSRPYSRIVVLHFCSGDI